MGRPRSHEPLPGANTRLPAGAKHVTGGADRGRRAVKRSRHSGPGAAAEGTAEGDTRKLCPHQRIRGLCKECGGASICPHQRIRSTCKECGGASICPHQRRRSQCKECREEADKAMSAGLEGLEEAGG